MAVIADASGLLAYFVRSEPANSAVTRFIEEMREPLVVSPFAIAEIDFLTARLAGYGSAIQAMKELSSDAYDLPAFGVEDLRAAVAVIERYPDQSIGITDASIVVLADRYRTREILTLDYRHFDVLRPVTGGGRFRLMPRDGEGDDA